MKPMGTEPPEFDGLPHSTMVTQRKTERMRILLGMVIGAAAMVVAVAALIVALSGGGGSSPSCASEAGGRERPRNVIFFISDGMGPSYVGLARDVVNRAASSGVGIESNSLILDSLVSGTAKTRSLDSVVTDSAAAATALATGASFVYKLL